MTTRYGIHWDGPYSHLYTHQDDEGATFAEAKRELRQYLDSIIVDYAEAKRELIKMKSSDVKGYNDQ